MTVSLDKWLQAKIKTQCVIDGERVYWGPPNEPIELVVHMHGNEPRVQLPGTKFLISLEDLITHGARMRRRPKLLTKADVNQHSWAVAGGYARWNRTYLPRNVYIANARTMDSAGDRGKPVPPARYIGRTGKYRTAVYDTVDEVVKALEEKRYVNV